MNEIKIDTLCVKNFDDYIISSSGSDNNNNKATFYNYFQKVIIKRNCCDDDDDDNRAKYFIFLPLSFSKTSKRDVIRLFLLPFIKNFNIKDIADCSCSRKTYFKCSTCCVKNDTHFEKLFTVTLLRRIKMNYNEHFEKYEICNNIFLILCNMDKNLSDISSKLKTFFFDKENFNDKKNSARETRSCTFCSHSSSSGKGEMRRRRRRRSSSILPSRFTFVIINYKKCLREVFKNILFLIDVSISSSIIKILNIVVC